jgi:ribonuclease J
LNTTAPVDGVLVSHPHQDHYGLLEEVPASWPVYCGAATARLIRLTSGILGKRVPEVFIPWESGVPFQIGPFRITPLLTDHSAFDAHMLLLDVHGKRICYSGDFRTHGRKSALPRRFMRSPPANVDVLLMEGTNLGGDKLCTSENDLENRFVELFRGTPGRVFVAWSAQNIDRAVTLYRACLKTGRTLVVDLYTAEVMEAVADFGKLPRPGWTNLRVVITGAFARVYRSTGRGAFVDRIAKYGISADKLTETPSKWVPMIRPSLVHDYTKKGVIPNSDDTWSWSMWKGYLKNEEASGIQVWFDRGGSRAEHIHSSGHASPSELKAFARAVNPTVLVPIHGVAWDDNTEVFPSIRRLSDGEPLAL